MPACYVVDQGRFTRVPVYFCSRFSGSSPVYTRLFLPAACFSALYYATHSAFTYLPDTFEDVWHYQLYEHTVQYVLPDILLLLTCQLQFPCLPPLFLVRRTPFTPWLDHDRLVVQFNVCFLIPLATLRTYLTTPAHGLQTHPHTAPAYMGQVTVCDWWHLDVHGGSFLQIRFWLNRMVRLPHTLLPHILPAALDGYRPQHL